MGVVIVLASFVLLGIIENGSAIDCYHCANEERAANFHKVPETSKCGRKVELTSASTDYIKDNCTSCVTIKAKAGGGESYTRKCVSDKAVVDTCSEDSNTVVGGISTNNWNCWCINNLCNTQFNHGSDVTPASSIALLTAAYVTIILNWL